MSNGKICKACGKPMRSHCKGNYHTKCKPSIYNIDGTCKICGKFVPLGKGPRGAHSLQHNGGPWSKGLTKHDHPSLVKTSKKISAAKKGKSAPWAVELCHKIGSDPECKRKAAETRRQKMENGEFIPYGGRPYGNGKPPPPSEIVAMKVLKPLGFYHQFVVGMGKGSSRPHHYKIDFAHPSKKIAIEIDGSSHRGREESDMRKDKRLSDRGWIILRFPATFDGQKLHDGVMIPMK